MSILYKVPGFEPATFGIESPPITTRPGLPSILLKARNWEYSQPITWLNYTLLVEQGLVRMASEQFYFSSFRI